MRLPRQRAMRFPLVNYTHSPHRNGSILDGELGEDDGRVVGDYDDYYDFEEDDNVDGDGDGSDT